MKDDRTPHQETQPAENRESQPTIPWDSAWLHANGLYNMNKAMHLLLTAVRKHSDLDFSETTITVGAAGAVTADELMELSEKMRADWRDFRRTAKAAEQEDE